LSDLLALWLKVYGGIFAATIDLEFELEPVALIERRHAGTLYRRDVDKGIGLAIVALNEAKAFHRVEKLDRAAGLLAGQLTLRATAAAASAGSATASALDGHRIAFDPQIGRRHAAATIDERELERLAIGQVGKTRLLDRRDVDEDVFAAVIADDEAEALLRIEEFYDALALANDLGRHSSASAAAAAAETTATAAATKAATAATAEATAAAAAIAATSTAAAAVAAALLEAAKISAESWFVTEPVTLVAAAPAAVALAPSIETHAPSELIAARLPLKPTRSGQMAKPVMMRKTTHAPCVPLQENSVRL
jgi:hypothetical protein